MINQKGSFHMFTERAFKRPAVLCALLLALCTLATYPFAEIGGNDDFSYVRSAKALAETGHVVFFGWSSTMLGWQLALGALFIKLFGFSFTVTRASILLVALCLTFLLQRTLVRLGLNETNAAFATLTLVLSPLFIPLSFSFMADIPGLLAIVLCLYLCLRAIKAPDPSQTNAWLIAAAVSSALLGTARQTGWLGVLVIVPSTCWLLRRRQFSPVLVTFVWSLCVLFIFAALHWFSHQMYTTAESFDGTAIDEGHVFNMALAGLRGLLQTAFFLSPIFIAFALAFLKTRNRWVYLSLAGAILFGAYLCLRPHSYWVGIVLAPASSGIGNYVTSRGILELPAIGNRPLVLNFAVRVVITVVSYFAAFAFLVLLITRRNRPVQAPEAMTSELSWRQIFILLGPFTLTYSVFLAFRVFSGVMFDRYLLPLFMVLAVVALRFYQERISPRLPPACFAVLLLFAAFGVAGTHDMFAEGRARLAAIEQLRAAGLPPTAFYAGFAYDGWTQIDAQGYIDANGIHTPTGIRHLPKAKRNFDNPCYYWAATFYPAIKPQYVISYDDFSCGNSDDRFAPVSYRLWLPPFSGALYSRSVTPELLSRSGK
jgi:hypothetical protein